MADIQLDANLSAKQVDDIVAFLHSLNGEVPRLKNRLFRQVGLKPGNTSKKCIDFQPLNYV